MRHGTIDAGRSDAGEHANKKRSIIEAAPQTTLMLYKLALPQPELRLCAFASSR